MAAPLTASMPQFTQLGYNTTIVMEALDPSTGAAVDGVSVTGVELWADVTLGVSETGSEPYAVGPYMLTGGPAA